MTHNDKVVLIVVGLEVILFVLFVYALHSERKQAKKYRIAQKEKRLRWILSLNYRYRVFYLEQEWDSLEEIFVSK